MDFASVTRHSRRRSFASVAGIVAVISSPPAFAGSWTGDFSIPGFDGSVRACAVHGGQYVVGGDFQWAGGVSARNIAQWTGDRWAPVGQGLPRPVARLVTWGTDLLAATESDGRESSPVMRFSAGSWRPLGPQLYGSAEALLIEGPNVYVAGPLFDVGLSNSPRVMKWDGGSWQAIGGGFDGRVLALAIYQGDLYAGGEFLNAEGQYVSRIARWDGAHWQPVAEGTNTGGNVSVRALAVYDGRLIAGGLFSSLGGVPARGVAAWNGAAWDSLPNTPKDCWIYDLVVEGDLLHAAGVLQVPNLWGSGFATFDGQSWRVPTPYPDWGIQDIAAQNGALVAVGYSSGLLTGTPAVDRVPVRDVVVRDPSWHALDSWRPSMRGLLGPSWTEVMALHVHQGELYAGGYLEYAAQSPSWTYTGPLARWTTDGWKPLGVDLRGWVHKLASWGDKLVVGGPGFYVGGVSSSVVAWEGNTWTDLGGPLEGWVSGLTEWQGTLIAAGGLRLPWQQAWSAVAIHRSSGWGILGEPLVADQSSVFSVATHRGELYVAGSSLSSAAGSSSLMRWDGARWMPVPGTQPGPAKCLLSRADGLWVGFGGYSLDGASVRRWDGERWTEVEGLGGEVLSLVEHGGEVYAGGALIANGVPTTLARWSGGGVDGGGLPIVASWLVIPDGPASAIETMASLGNDLWVGGWFSRLQGGQAEAIARWTLEDAPGPTVVAGSMSSWPNPARERILFRIALPRAGRATLTLYDLHGAKVATLVDEDLPVGPVERSWSIPSTRVPTGIYFARLEAPGISFSSKVVVAR